MDKKTIIIAAVAVAALIVAAVSLAVTFTVLSTINSNHPTPTPMPTQPPTLYPTQPTNPPTASPTTTTNGAFHPEITLTYRSTATEATSPLTNVNTTKTIPSGTYIINVNVANSASNAPSTTKYIIQFTFTEENKNAAQAGDLGIKIFTEPEGPPQYTPPFRYSDYSTILFPDVNGNKLTFICAPSGENWSGGIEGLSSEGFQITSGFNQTLKVQVTVNEALQMNMAVNLVPA